MKTAEHYKKLYHTKHEKQMTALLAHSLKKRSIHLPDMSLQIEIYRLSLLLHGLSPKDDTYIR